MDTYPFVLSPSDLIRVLSRDFLEKYHSRVSFTQRGEIIPEFDSHCQNSQSGDLNNFSTSSVFFFSFSDSTVTESGSTDQLSLVDQLPSSLWAKSSTDNGRIHSVPPTKIQNGSLEISSQN